MEAAVVKCLDFSNLEVRWKESQENDTGSCRITEITHSEVTQIPEVSMERLEASRGQRITFAPSDALIGK